MEAAPEIKHQIQPPSHRSISLGLRLALSTALIITLVMGGISVSQQWIGVKEEQQSRQELLQISLAPLAVRLEQAATWNTLNQYLQDYHQAYRLKGFPTHDVVLSDASGKPVLSTLPSNNTAEGADYFRATVPIVSPLVEGGKGTLTLLRDTQEFRGSVRRGWLLWLVHFAITVSVVCLFLATAIYFQVTKPVNRLLQGVKKMEMGYWGPIDAGGGAWEIRWLAWRFGNMVQEVRNSMIHLFEAEREARLQMVARAGATMPANSLWPVVSDTDTPDSDSPSVSDELIAVCRKLEAATPNDPEAVELAHGIWRHEAVIANRYGLHQIKARLEDAALRLMEPDNYLVLDNRLTELKVFWRDWAEQHRDEICRQLDREFIPCAEVLHRVKHTAGVWAKMKRKGLEFDEVYDLFAFRIILPTEADCYAALGVIHQLYKPEVSRFKDYIADPKGNGYRSLHTCVKAADGPMFEVQIRSIAMDQQAERGDAAHWLYKKDGSEAGKESEASRWWLRLLKTISR